MNIEEQTYSTNTGEFIAEKLLPCPFCGGEPEFITIGNDYTKSRKAEIKCTNCFVKRTTGAIRNDLEWCGRKAIELWNKRTNSLSFPPAEGAEVIGQALHEAAPYGLQAEVMASTIQHLRENPEIDLSVALQYGLQDWDI